MGLRSLALRSTGRLIWLVDLDDTLVMTAQFDGVAARSAQEVFAQFLGDDLAAKLTESYLSKFRMLYRYHRFAHPRRHIQTLARDPDDDALRALLDRVSNLQQSSPQTPGWRPRNFSREVLFQASAEDVAVTLPQGVLRVAADAYWGTVARQVPFAPGALEFGESVQSRGEKLYILTSSDGRMTQCSNGRLAYDVDLSVHTKEARLDALRGRGLAFERGFIGDPIDKPDPEFFRTALREIARSLGRGPDPSVTVMVGDSFKSDLATPLERRLVTVGVHIDDSSAAVDAADPRLLRVPSFGGLLNVIRDVHLGEKK